MGAPEEVVHEHSCPIPRVGAYHQGAPEEAIGRPSSPVPRVGASRFARRGDPWSLLPRTKSWCVWVP